MTAHQRLAGLIQELTAIPAPAGFEDPMIARMRDTFATIGEPAVDRLGNVMVRVTEPRSPAAPRVMVFAHMDELGCIVRKIEPDGFLRIERLGGLPEKSLAGQRMLVGTVTGEYLDAVVGTKAHHLTPAAEKERVLPASEVFLDAGFSSRADALEAGVRVGSPVVYARSFSRRGEQIYANALDNRVGCAVLLALAELLGAIDIPGEVWLVASVQEEYNLRGVLPAARRVAPDLAICLDISPAYDTPDLAGGQDVVLGGGPTLGTYSFHSRGTLAGVIPNPKLLAFFEAVAAEAAIPVQRSVFFGGLTDASFLQLEQGGIPSIDIGFPCRYTHAPVEACHLGDVAGCVALLTNGLAALDALDLRRG